jgi:hypothetical protein
MVCRKNHNPERTLRNVSRAATSMIVLVTSEATDDVALALPGVGEGQAEE